MITLPLHDLPTRSASGFLMRYVMPRSTPPQLVGGLDRKPLFSIQAVGDCIIGVGHGSPDAYAGHNNEILMSTDDIPNVQDKIIILLACQTARDLGPKLIAAGASAYIGWQEDFVWVMDADHATTPWSDDWASPVIMPVVGCVNDVLDGKSAGEAYDRMLEEFVNAVSEEDEDLIISCLIFNQKNAVFLGDRDAKIRPTPRIKVPIPPPPIILPISG